MENTNKKQEIKSEWNDDNFSVEERERLIEKYPNSYEEVQQVYLEKKEEVLRSIN